MGEMAMTLLLLTCLWGVVWGSDPAASDTGEVRLVNGSSRCTGRVEVYHKGQWGTICDDDWGMEEARVVCQQLGCTSAIAAVSSAQFGRGTGDIQLDNIKCNGTEISLTQCLVRPWGENSCKRGQDAGVVCEEPVEMRLVNGSSRCSGRVEVFHLQQYGTVCDDGWDMNDAAVVCRNLDCGTPLYAPRGAQFGRGMGPIWLDDVECAGTESSLADCKANPWGTSNCNHGEDASVVCSDDLRLVNGSNRCNGRVEFRPPHSERWGTICDRTWDINDADVVCRQLGCGKAGSVLSGARFGPGAGSIWLDAIHCKGTERAISECKANTQGNNNCHHGQDAAVICSGKSITSVANVSLVDSLNSCAGKIEVLYQQQWGTMCDDGWDLSDANVVCKELNCSVALEAPLGACYGCGSDPIWLDDVGSSSDVWGSDSAASDTGEVTLVNGSSHCSGRVEVLHDGQWGTVCDDDWGMEEARVVCRQLGCKSAIAAVSSAQFGRGTGDIRLDNIKCNGTEISLTQCLARPWGENNCNNGDDAGVVCEEVRLTGGPSSCSGRVEVFHNQQWGTVCDNGWDMKEARVVCKEVDCGEAKAAPGRAKFGQGSGPAWMNGVNCTGSEDSLSKCPAEPLAEHSCDHSNDAGVECAEPVEMRLVNGSSRCSGRVEVFHLQQYGTVCDDSWDMNDAAVVCRHLDCGTPLYAPRGAQFGRGMGPIWLDDVECAGTESSLADCKANPWGISNCNHREDASVVCSDDLRLVNGSNRCSGRVEIRPPHSERWGTVCDRTWDINDAEVVCRQLGCGKAGSVLSGAHFGPGSDSIWLDDINCKGTEGAISECKANTQGNNNCHHGQDAAVICSGKSITNVANVRLVNGPNSCAGRIEVFYQQQWGTVCDDGWDLTDASVVCKQLNCGIALEAPHGARYGRGAERIWLDDVNCTGSEDALKDCEGPSAGEHNCGHSEDASVICSGDVRLVNGSSSCNGRVEVLHNGTWGTVCDDDWGMEEAKVVCRQVGCTSAIAAVSSAHFGRGSDPIWLDNIECNGTELSLTQCPSRPWGQNNCNHGEDAGVICAGDVRLVNGSSSCNGRVEVLHNGTWGTVCDDNWGMEDARVVCRQVGCTSAIAAVSSAHFGRGSDPIWLDEVECKGTELSLTQCPSRPWGQNNCNHGKDAGVICADDLRLVNGSNRCSGRVEIRLPHSEQWGTVCNRTWDINDAEVVCRQLGCGKAGSVLSGAHFGPGSGSIWLDAIHCKGTEGTISECKANTQGNNTCHHGQDAAVICSGKSITNVANVRLVDGPNPCAGRIEVLFQQLWGTVCDDGWDMSDANAVCKELNCGVALEAPHGARYGRGSDPIWLDDVNCTGSEDALKDCEGPSVGVHNCGHSEDASVICSDSGEVRLVSGSSRCSGRVEVFHNGQWGTVCDDDWGMEEARVVCRQLGCTSAIEAVSSAHFGRGTDPIWLDNVECKGTELSLTQCPARPWGENNCNHGEDAGVICADAGEVRLASGSSRCSGRVEVYHKGQWGTVCDDNWGMEEARVVCRQLGCTSAIEAVSSAHFGSGSDPIWLDDVECKGTELSLTQCPARPWGENNCNHGEDAGVICADSSEVRLASGSSRCSGRVEVFHNSKWGTVCDDDWGMEEARVVCRQVGCTSAIAAVSSAHFGRGTDPIWLDDVECKGTELSLTQCPARPWGENNCNHGEDAGVICADSGEVRLASGSSRCSGRVEVLHDGQWGTICDDDWGMEEARVVCQQVGCTSAISAVSSAHFGRGTDPIWLDYVECKGTELSLTQCPARTWGENNCNHGEDAGVICEDTGKVRLVNGSSRCSGRVEVFHNGQWGTVCDDNWGMEEARVVCRQMGCTAAIEAVSGARFGRGTDPIWLDNVECKGTELSLTQCPARPWGENNCNHGEDVGVICADATD